MHSPTSEEILCAMQTLSLLLELRIKCLTDGSRARAADITKAENEYQQWLEDIDRSGFSDKSLDDVATIANNHLGFPE